MSACGLYHINHKTIFRKILESSVLLVLKIICILINPEGHFEKGPLTIVKFYIQYRTVLFYLIMLLQCIHIL